MKYKILLIIALFILSSKVVFAENNAVKKLSRGFVNVVSAPIEVPKQIRNYWIEGARKTDHILVWLGSGAGWGLVQTVKRMGSGLWDMISFPFNKPQNFEPLLKPDYVLENWPRNPDTGW